MDIQKVIDHVLADPFFAADLAAKAGRASRARSGVPLTSPLQGAEWHDLLSVFADSPEELARLLPSESAVTPEDDTVATTMTVTTLMTVTTMTTLPCAFTTTTTTTTVTATTTTTHPV